jgi:Ni/Co efflux regulator RcnB
MKKNKWASACVLALLCLAQGSALAQPGNGNGNRNGHGNNSRCGNGDQGCMREEMRNNDPRRVQDHNRRPPPPRQPPPRIGHERGAGPGHSFYRGERLPSNYRTRQYVVNDWRGHGLRSPPRGYHWVQTGSDYVLVAIATGVILELLLNY